MKSKNYTDRSTLRAVDFVTHQLKYLLKFGKLTDAEGAAVYEAYEKLTGVRTTLFVRCPNPYGEWKKFFDRRQDRKTTRQDRKRLALAAKTTEKTK